MKRFILSLGRLALRAALKSFPHRLRERYGDEPVDLFLTRLERRLVDRGLPAALRMIVGNTANTLAAGLRARSEERSRAARPSGLRDIFVHAGRRLRRSPRFAVLLIIPMALSLAATLSAFSIVDAVVIRPLPFPRSEHVHLLGRLSGDPRRVRGISMANCGDFRERLETPERVHCIMGGRVSWESPDGLEMLPVARVDEGTLEMLGARTVRGRAFLPSDFTESGPVLLGHRAWQARWGGRESVVGSALELNGQLREVAGVLAPDVHLPEILRSSGGASDPAIWIPLEPARTFDDQTRAFAFGRAAAVLPPDGSAEALADEVRAVGRGLVEEHPEANRERDGSDRVWGTESLRRATAREARPRLLLLATATLFLLGIAVANSVNLVLVRASERAREMTVRRLLGASRWRVAAERVVESILLCLVAGGLGVLLATWATDAFVALQPLDSDIPRLSEIGLNARVLAAGFGVAVMSGLLVGALPTLFLMGRDLGDGLRGERSSGTRLEGRARGFFVAMQTAVALALMANAALVVSSLNNLLTVDRGFEPQDLWIAQVELPNSLQEDESVTLQYFLDARERLEALPGAVSASATVFLHGETAPLTLEVQGPDGRATPSGAHVVLPHFFETMGIPILEGRDLSADEHRPSGARALVLGRSLAEELFPAGDALGAEVGVEGADEAPWTVVGVAGDTRSGFRAPEAERAIYMPFHQWAWLGSMVMLVRTGPGGGTGFGQAIPAAIRELDERVPSVAAFELQQVLSESAGEPRFYGWLLSAFSVIALLLSAIGLYATLSFAVARRTRELAIRMALGARSREVLVPVVRSAVLAVALGCALGVGLALGLGRLLEWLLFGLSRTDPGIFFMATASLLAVALLAAWIPGRRATRTEPMEALREE